MNTLLSEHALNLFIQGQGNKFLYIYSPHCPACVQAQEIIDQSNVTLSIMVQSYGKIDINDCREFCGRHQITNTPTFMLIDELGSEISRLDFSPSHDDFLIWITTMID